MDDQRKLNAKISNIKRPPQGFDFIRQKARTPESSIASQPDEIDAQTAKAPTPPEKTPLRPLLQQLGEELDQFHKSPESYDLKRLEEIVKEFLGELRDLMQDSGHFYRIKESFTPNPSNLWEVFQRVRKMIRSNEVDDYGLDRTFEMAIKPAFDFLFYRYFRVQIKGLEHIPNEGRCLLVANHSGVLPYDAAMIKIGIFNEHPARRDLRFLVDDFVFHFPFLGIFMNRIGGVRACPENAERLLRSDELVSVFPEGIKGISKKFSERYKLQRFGRGGTIRLALKTKSPIVPVAVIGAEELHPLIFKSTFLARPLGLPFVPVTPTFPWLGPLGAIPLPTKWSIIFGKPIPFDQYTAKDLNDGIVISRETERLRSTIQEMIKEGLKERSSIFFG